MMQHFYTEGENADSYAICALLHDLCKANFYKVRHSQREETTPPANGRKCRFTRWLDQLPYGHGEKERVISHRAFRALENCKGYCYPLAYGRVDDAVTRAAALP